MAPGVQGALVCLALLAPSPARAAPYWKGNRHKPYRVAAARCQSWDCPAFQRPIQKLDVESAYQIWSFEECPNRYRATVFLEDFATCCRQKFICAQTCGIGVQECYDIYWRCAEEACARGRPRPGETKGTYTSESWEPECLNAASYNDFRWLSATPEVEVRALKAGEACDAFHTLQSESCDCVPQAEWEQRVQTRLEDFMRKYAPEQLSEKGRLKDKKKWKAWKGQRPLMFNRFLLDHQGALVSFRNVTATAKAWTSATVDDDEEL